MRKSFFLLPLLSVAVIISCQKNDPIDIGQGYMSESLSAPWHGKTDETRFCFHSTAERLFFSFEVTDSTIYLVDPFSKERDVEPEDRVEVFFAPDPSLKKAYYCAEIDPQGHIMDYKAEYFRKFDFEWNFSTMEACGQITPWGYRVNASVSRGELESLGIDIDKSFWIGAFRGDAFGNGEIEWYSLVAPDVSAPDFHVPGVLFECKATPCVERRGVVVYPDDVTSLGVETWGKRVDISGINLIGLHAATSNDPVDTLEKFVRSELGQDFLAMCRARGVDVEYELHALEYLLPRDLFESHPEYFRMDENGNRCPDYNMCFSCDEAIEAMRPRLEKLLEWVKPTTHRYYFWTDDKLGVFCNCADCASLSPSEQALKYENRLVAVLREYDPDATLAHLAYQQTLDVPVAVRADDCVFLEYAPINRNYSQPLSEEHIKAMENNLLAFPGGTAHVLEYWLDESMFCRWRKESPVPVPFEAEKAAEDIDRYRKLGFADFTCFAAWLNSRYDSVIAPADSLFADYGKAFDL